MNTNLESNKGKVIPATKRPDGTWRKARRVKDGYVPQEEVPLYESKGKQFSAQRQTGVPPGMCPILAAEIKKVREKKEKAKEKKVEKQQLTKIAARPTTDAARMTNSSTTNNIHNESPKDCELSKLTKTLDKNLTIVEEPEMDIAKQIKKLKKKIREIEQIETKIQSGDINKLDKDQMEKVKKKPEILRQLKTIEESSTAIKHS
ncbi:partner of Y14 and mago [Drosophila hydei]|uniref:Partner of Y14 and mago n=1 Tax=Drosophila hydei TaxID=7224 RepID=A0A6J1M0R6_DROHY|nr:partner of Y14 and mago [Drosophila hydei]